MSELRVDTIAAANGTDPATFTKQWGIKAFLSANGTGTIAINSSGNVSSITDLGTGQMTVTFTNAMANANYSVSGACEIGVASGSTIGLNDVTASSFEQRSINTSNAVIDVNPSCSHVIGELA